MISCENCEQFLLRTITAGGEAGWKLLPIYLQTTILSHLGSVGLDWAPLILRKISSPVGGMSCTQPQMFPNICLVMRFNLIWPKSLIKQIVIEMILIYFKLQIKEWRNRDCRVSATSLLLTNIQPQLWWFNRPAFVICQNLFKFIKKIHIRLAHLVKLLIKTSLTLVVDIDIDSTAKGADRSNVGHKVWFDWPGVQFLRMSWLQLQLLVTIVVQLVI